MIKAWLVGDRETVARFEGMPARLHGRLSNTILKWALKLEGHVKVQKLSGQVLKVRTGTLRRSVTHRVDTLPDVILGIVGTNVTYAARHEYGFHGSEMVRAHLRTVKQAFGKELKGGARQISIRAHARRVDYPAHSFLRSALRDLNDAIVNDMRATAGEVMSA